MAIKTYRPITPTLRFKTTLVNDGDHDQPSAQGVARTEEAYRWTP